MPDKKKDESPVARASAINALLGLAREAASVESAGRELLKKIRASYQDLHRDDRPLFFTRLMENIEVRPEDLGALVEALPAASSDPAGWRRALTGLRAGIESPRRKLFRNFLGLPGGLKFLLDLRADILRAQRRGEEDFSPLDFDLNQLFESWFQDGFLFLREISLDSPFRQIEIIMNGDMVHPMTRLEEMGRRLGRDRRCFALYHRAMDEEPVVFIEVALTRGIVRSIHDILGETENGPLEGGRTDTAVFYSINNTQNGLAGLGLGKVLIFQVVDFLRQEEPQIKTFCTLSPLPGFWRRYLKPLLEGKGEAKGFRLTMDELEKMFDKRVRALLDEHHAAQGGDPENGLPRVLLSTFSNAAWAENRPLVEGLDKPLRQLGYYYLAEEKSRHGRPLDPVANFHLGNGAAITPRHVNFGANWSAMGLERSLSLMANYVYSQTWATKIGASLTALGGYMPGLGRRRSEAPIK